MELILNQEMIRNKLEFMIMEIYGIKIEDADSSLFSFKYNFPAEGFVYLLLRASKEFNFKINDDLVDSLTDYSFNNVVDVILDQLIIKGDAIS